MPGNIGFAKICVGLKKQLFIETAYHPAAPVYCMPL